MCVCSLSLASVLFYLPTYGTPVVEIKLHYLDISVSIAKAPFFLLHK